MATTQHTPRCPVYLHPAAATNRAAVEAIQQRTGLLVIISSSHRSAKLHAAPNTSTEVDPWGGDAA